jgi:peptidyl-prolyl cis-trans isomerase SurA
MIDKQLLLSKGKTLNINCDSDVIRQLDDIRKQNHLDSMEALEKAAQQQGISYEDFKQQIRESCITQKVVSEEVGRRLNMTHAGEEAYYA